MNISINTAFFIFSVLAFLLSVLGQDEVAQACALLAVFLGGAAIRACWS